MVPIKWSFYTDRLPNVVELRGECPDMHSETLLLIQLNNFIEKATKFKGIPIQNLPLRKIIYTTTIDATVLFPSQKELDSFIKSVVK